MRSDRSGGVLPREGRVDPGGQEGLPHLRRARRVPRVRADERRALRHLGRSLRARAPQAEEARRLSGRRPARTTPRSARPGLLRWPRAPRRVPIVVRVVIATVAALLVSHDGARWLPAGARRACAAAAARSTAVVAVDTGSTRRQRRPARRRLRRRATPSPGATGYPAAVRARPRPSSPHRPPAPEWVWLLHDDATPAPDALERAARRRRGAPRGRRPRPQAARVALAAAAARGRRHDLRHRSARDRPRARRVRPGPARRGPRRCSRSTPPACWCAAAVLEELGGFDEQLPIFGNDLDFGWRAAAAGHHDPGRPAGRGLPRRGRPPRRPPDRR